MNSYVPRNRSPGLVLCGSPRPTVYARWYERSWFPLPHDETPRTRTSGPPSSSEYSSSTASTKKRMFRRYCGGVTRNTCPW
ncbi:MAG: hypothetical protein ACXWX9_02480 [Actinomycetota bacterium]